MSLRRFRGSAAGAALLGAGVGLSTGTLGAPGLGVAPAVGTGGALGATGAGGARGAAGAGGAAGALGTFVRTWRERSSIKWKSAIHR